MNAPPSSLYYSEFRGETFVIQAGADAVENADTMRTIVRGVGDLIRHDIRVALVFGKGTRCTRRLDAEFGTRQHPETNRLVVSEKALPLLRAERLRIANLIAGVCQEAKIPHSVLPDARVRAERRIAHGSTGIVAAIDLPAVQAVLNAHRLAVLGFGGQDERHRFLHVPSLSLAADLAVQMQAHKLLLLTQDGGIFVPGRKGAQQQLSFADMEQLLCLLQRRDSAGDFILANGVLPLVHASIRAVAGGVSQVHIVPYTRLLDEILTLTGVGTMIERQQSHHVDYAGQEDLEEIERLHSESQRYTTPRGTAFVKPLDRTQLERLLPETLVLTHREFIIGKLHATEIPGAPQIRLIGGFVIGENHQDSQHGQLLLSEALARFREEGDTGAAAITASERARRLFERNGGVATAEGSWQQQLLEHSRKRYHPDERGLVQLFEFTL